MSRSPADSKIPILKTIEEEAEFWDSHDTTEFEDEFEPIDVVFARPLIRRDFEVPLDGADCRKASTVGRGKGH